MKYIKVLGLSVIVLMGLMITSNAQVIVPVGTTTRQSSQLIMWYDQVSDLGRFSFIQVTNGSLDSGVTIHVQIFASECTDFNLDTFECDGQVFRCVEHDFNDFLTPGDTDVFDLGNLSGIDIENTKGFVVVTAVQEENGEAISFQHLFGNSYVYDLALPGMHRLNSMGRDAVSFTTGNITPEGDPLNGVSNGFVLIQPEVLKFNYIEILEVDGHEGFTNLADVISISFADDYDGSALEGYAAEPADATWTPLIFDESETPTSCSPVPQDCFFDIGLNDVILVANPFLDNDKVLCPGNDNDEGWMRINVSGLGDLENEVGIYAVSRSLNTGDATWMYAEGEVIEPIPTPTPTPIPPTPTPTPLPPGGGGGCAVAGPVSGMGISIVGMLIPLVPAFGIGLRRLLRR